MSTKSPAPALEETPARKLVAHFLAHPPHGVTLELLPEMYLWRGRQVEYTRHVALVNIERKGGEPGAGALAMRALCARADELGVILVLSVRPKDQPLIAYYRAFQFEPMPSRNEYYAMRRAPAGAGPSALNKENNA